MPGGGDPSSPRPAAEAPRWAAALLRDVVDWVLAIRRGPQGLTLYNVAALPDAAKWRGAFIHVRDESGGEVPAFSDGTNWRRVTDRAICT